MVHGFGDVDKVLPELAGHIFIDGIFGGELKGDGAHIERVHGHPTGAIGLLNVPAGGKLCAAIEDADVIEP